MLHNMELLVGVFLIVIFSTADGRCSHGCDVALASYYFWEGTTTSCISRATQTPISRILSYNPELPHEHYVWWGKRVNVPFRCDCLGHVFTYTSSPGDTYELIAGTYYANLTTAQWMERNNRYPAGNILDGVALNVTVNCSGASPSIIADTSIKFLYKELAKATNDFSIAHKIGEGGFGAVYYAELRGQKAAIKKMDMRASKEFLAELKVHLIGYCVQRSLFLVYEYIDNGNLSQHLRHSDREPLPWSTRVQIALDSARGLEYIHEHTVSVYVHRDIKPANILIDKNFHAKVADFGLTKLAEVENSSLPTGPLVGTFAYMPPECAQYRNVSLKVDVYALGVVLYELISAKEAVVKTNGSSVEPRSLVALFEETLDKPDPTEELSKLIDPRLGESYSLELVQKMAQLARVCTHKSPQLRPSMKSIVVALMAFSSSTANLDVGSL